MQDAEFILECIESEFWQQENGNNGDYACNPAKIQSAPQNIVRKVGADAADTDKHRGKQNLYRLKDVKQPQTNVTARKRTEQIESMVEHHTQYAEPADFIQQRDAPMCAHPCQRPTFFCTLRSVFCETYSAFSAPDFAHSAI